MPNLEDIPEAAALELARECVHRFLSAFATDPYTPGWERIQDQQGQALAVAAMDLIREWAEQNPTPRTFGELPPEALDLRPLVADLSKPLADLRAEHDRVFGLIAPKECPPYETEYHPPGQTFLRSQQTADVAGFYHAFGLQPGGASHERPDHIALELEFIALLLTKKRMAQGGHTVEETGTGSDRPRAVPVPISEDDSARESADRIEICDQALHNFVRDHLAWWVPAFAAGLRRKADHGPYHALSNVLAALIPVERAILGIAPPFQPVQPELIETPEEQSGCIGCS